MCGAIHLAFMLNLVAQPYSIKLVTSISEVSKICQLFLPHFQRPRRCSRGKVTRQVKCRSDRRGHGLPAIDGYGLASCLQ
jgi:hypothetical protein